MSRQGQAPKTEQTPNDPISASVETHPAYGQSIHIMRLTNEAVREARPGEKPYKLSDGGSLYVLVHPRGGKYWRYKYCFGGKEKLLALGVFPDVLIDEARSQRDLAKSTVRKARHRNNLPVHHLTATHRRHLRLALRYAIEWEESAIDSYKCAWSKRRNKKGMPVKIIPKDFLPQANRCRRNIENFKRVLEVLQ